MPSGVTVIPSFGPDALCGSLIRGDPVAELMRDAFVAVERSGSFGGAGYLPRDARSRNLDGNVAEIGRRAGREFWKQGRRLGPLSSRRCYGDYGVLVDVVDVLPTCVARHVINQEYGDGKRNISEMASGERLSL